MNLPSSGRSMHQWNIPQVAHRTKIKEDTDMLCRRCVSPYECLADNNKLKYSKKESTVNVPNFHSSLYEKKISQIISEIISNFLLEIIAFITDMSDVTKDPSVILSSSNNFSSIPKNFKIISQLFLEIQLFNRVLIKYSQLNEELDEKFKYLNNLLFNKLLSIKGKKGERTGDESVIFDKEEINMKSQILEQYMTKYASYLKCFN